MPKQINIMVIVLSLILGLFSLSFSQESMTITTYYPSPYGSYNELRTNQMSIGSGYVSSTLNNGNLIVEGSVGIGTPAPGYALDVIGNIRADAFLYNSDIRLKDNMRPLDGKLVLGKILSLTPIAFDWKDTHKNDIGLIAQEIEAAFPQLAKRDQNGYLSVDYPKLVVFLVGAIKEQQAEIDKLKQKIK